MTAAVIVAGGRSARSGRQHKSCRRFPVPGERRTWLDRQVDQLRRAGFAPVTVVTGLRPRRLLSCLHRRVRLRHCRTARSGPFHTLCAGLGNVRGPVLHVQSDTVLPHVPLLRRLRHSGKRGRAVATSLRDQRGHGGHPLLLSGAFAGKLLDMFRKGGETRLDRELRRLSAQEYVRIPVRRQIGHPRLDSRRAWHAARRKLKALR